MRGAAPDLRRWLARENLPATALFVLPLVVASPWELPWEVESGPRTSHQRSDTAGVGAEAAGQDHCGAHVVAGFDCPSSTGLRPFTFSDNFPEKLTVGTTFMTPSSSIAGITLQSVALRASRMV